MDLPKYLKDLQGVLDGLLEVMHQNDLAELEIEGEGHKIRLRKNEARVAPASIAPIALATALPAAPPAAAAPAVVEGAPAAAAGKEKLQVVKSPLVGTFYRAASPDAEPFVHEGDRVEAESVLCIIEAMKVMNEIQAGVAGVVREILVQNGEPVEFGEPLFRIETS
jgi:acetyl-CoA carboxylase biotin carboxyl carrier protein